MGALVMIAALASGCGGSAEVSADADPTAPTTTTTTVVLDFDAEAALMTALADLEQPVDEVARVPWRGGFVAIVSAPNLISERYADPVVVLPEEFFGSSTGEGCRDWGRVAVGDPTLGFLFAVVENDSFHVTSLIDGEVQTLPLIPGTDGRAVAFLDWSDYPNLGHRALVIKDANGDPVPCIQ